MPAAPAIKRPAHNPAADDAVRLSIAMDRLYFATGSFGEVVRETQANLRRLAARVVADGGSLEGWIG